MALPGRPPELTTEIAKRLAEAFQDGASIRVACGLVGINPTTYTNWMKAGLAGDERFVPFLALMNKSRARPELEAYQAIRKAFLHTKNPDWKAAAKYLELKDPRRWKRDEPKSDKQKDAENKPDYSKYRSDPVAFAEDILGVKLWSKQAEILRALVTHKRVLAKSANSIGKTVVAAVASIWFHACFQGVGLVTAPKYDQIKDVTFKEIRKYYNQAELDPKALAPKAPEIQVSPEHFLKGSTASDPSAYQGHHADNMMIVFEEATAIDAPFWEAASGMLAGGTNTFWLAILNPTDTSSTAYQEEQSGRWHVIDISALEHPNIKAELAGEAPPYPSAVRLAQLRSNLSQWATVVSEDARQPIDFDFDGKLFRPKPEAEARILGRYPSQASASIFNGNAFDLAEMNDVTFSKDEPIEVGCDVARFGDDLTSIHVRRGPVSLEHITYHGQDTAWTAGKLKETCRKWAVHFSTQEEPMDPRKIACKIDDSGVGGGVVDQADGYNFVPVNSANSALDDDYPNVRSELLFNLADKLDKGRISLRDLDADTVAEIRRQATVVTYKLDAKGRRVACPKDDLKKRLKRSPDDLDGLSLAYYSPQIDIEFF